MLKIYLVTYRLVVLGFFRRNFYVFLVLFILMFGIVYPPQFFFSRFFAELVYADISGIVGVLMAVLIYSMWTGWFLAGLVKKPENQYLKVIYASGGTKTWAWSCWISLGVQMPLLFFLGVLAVNGLFLASTGSFAILVGIILALLGPAIRLYMGIVGIGVGSSWKRLPFLMDWFPQSKPALMITNNFLSRQSLLVMITKPLAIVLLLGVLWRFPDEKSNPEAFHLAFLLLILLYAIYPYWFFRGEEDQMQWMRGLPFSIAHRFGHFTVAYLILLVPEILVLLVFSIFFGHSPLLLLDFLLGYLGITLLQHSLFYTAKTDLLSFIKATFGIFFLLFIALLFQVPFYALGGGMLIISWLVFRFNYFRWDPQRG